jgi:ABC-type antimicrobial peptide transport system permease subunit
MNWRDVLHTALDAVRSHRLRSALTMLGILIGITAVVLTVGIGQGARAEVQDDINALGTNLLVISPGSSTSTAGVRGGFGSASTLTVQDADSLRSNSAAPDITAVAPVSTTSGSLENGSDNWTTTITGTTPSWTYVRTRSVANGRFLKPSDQADSKAVVVLGSDTASELFSGRDPVGETVSYNGVKLEVIGVLEPLSSSSETASNDVALVPLSTYQQRLVGGTNRNSVSSIYIKAGSSSTLTAAYQEADRILLNNHGITNASDADFNIATAQSVLSTANSVDDTLTVMLGGIAFIALLVGGIGVMNIMLVSVTERIREIGLRKAIGARPSSIRRQFVVEAGVLGLAGGILGVITGVVGAVVIPAVSDTRIEISIPAALVAIVVAMGIGMIFGVYPASRAARLAPIDALRSE